MAHQSIGRLLSPDGNGSSSLRNGRHSPDAVPLESILCTEELHRRPSRSPDYEKENRALAVLAKALAHSPRAVLQKLADTILEVLQSDSAGVSLLTTDDGGKRFYWPAIAGQWKPHIGGGTPRDFGPCGDVLDRNTPLLFTHVERRYAYFQPVVPPVEEALLVPFYVSGKAVGTIWAVAHTKARKFDAEDQRILISLADFVSSAYQILASLDALKNKVEEHDKIEAALLRTQCGMDEKITILMVDDQPSKLLTYEAILADLGENLIKAHSGSEALDHLLKTDIAVVLMDVNMPEIDGFELATMIHQHPRFENTAIIFVSGVRMSDSDKLKGYEHGAADYISVPVVPELLRAKVKVFAELHRKSQQLETLNARIITLQDEERRRIARELHDSVGQLLAAVSMNSAVVQAESHKLSPQATKCLAENSGLIEEINKEIRTMSHLLHPPLLDEAGLASALRLYVEGFAERSKVEVKLDIPADFGRVSKEMELSIFRVAQECLTNIHRHAESPTAGIRITQEDGHLTVEIEDAGKGVPLEKQLAMASAHAGVGFRGMRERLRRLGGTLEIQSNGHGTRVTAILPVVGATATAASQQVA